MKTLFLCLLWAGIAAAQVSPFPGSPDTNGTLKVAADNCSTMLTVAMAPGDTSAQVANATCIPNNSIITIDAEQMGVCAITGNTLTFGSATVCPSIAGRGMGSTVVTTHAVGAPGYLLVNAYHHNALVSAVEATQAGLLPLMGTWTDLGAAIAATPAGGTLNIAAGTYAGPVTISKSLHVLCQPGAMIAGATNDATVTISAGNVSVDGCGLKNTSTGDAIDVYNAGTGAITGVTLSRLTIPQAGAIGIYCQGTPTARISNFLIDSVKIGGTAGDPIYCQDYLSGFEIKSSALDNTGAPSSSHVIGVHQVAASGSTTTVDSINIHNNVITMGLPASGFPDSNFGVEYGFFGGDRPIPPVTRANVSNNIFNFQSFANGAVSFSNASDSTASGNIIHHNGYCIGIADFEQVGALRNHATNNDASGVCAAPAPIFALIAAYVSGITAVGTTGQTCTLTNFDGGGTGAAATVALTGTNTIAEITQLVFTSPITEGGFATGSGYTRSPTTATVGTGTATSCTGTPVLEVGLFVFGQAFSVNTSNYTVVADNTVDGVIDIGTSSPGFEEVHQANYNEVHGNRFQLPAGINTIDFRGCIWLQGDIAAEPVSYNNIHDNYCDGSDGVLPMIVQENDIPSESGTVSAGTYIGGITATGTAGQTCYLYNFNGGGSQAVALVALTGTNTIASGTPLFMQDVGRGFTSAPTTAAVATFAATCSGPATVSTTVTVGGSVMLDGNVFVNNRGENVSALGQNVTNGGVTNSVFGNNSVPAGTPEYLQNYLFNTGASQNHAFNPLQLPQNTFAISTTGLVFAQPGDGNFRTTTTTLVDLPLIDFTGRPVNFAVDNTSGFAYLFEGDLSVQADYTGGYQLQVACTCTFQGSWVLSPNAVDNSYLTGGSASAAINSPLAEPGVGQGGVLASGTYVSGITATGTVGQTCTLSFIGSGTAGSATVALTGTNTIAGGTTLVMTNSGSGYATPSTSADVANGTATCTGPAAVTTDLEVLNFLHIRGIIIPLTPGNLSLQAALWTPSTAPAVVGLGSTFRVYRN